MKIFVRNTLFCFRWSSVQRTLLHFSQQLPQPFVLLIRQYPRENLGSSRASACTPAVPCTGDQARSRFHSRPTHCRSSETLLRPCAPACSGYCESSVSSGSTPSGTVRRTPLRKNQRSRCSSLCDTG